MSVRVFFFLAKLPDGSGACACGWVFTGLKTSLANVSTDPVDVNDPKSLRHVAAELLLKECER